MQMPSWPKVWTWTPCLREDGGRGGEAVLPPSRSSCWCQVVHFGPSSSPSRRPARASGSSSSSPAASAANRSVFLSLRVVRLRGEQQQPLRLCPDADLAKRRSPRRCGRRGQRDAAHLVTAAKAARSCRG